MTNNPLQVLEARLNPLRQELIDHSVYNHINSLEALQLFTQSHVFAVWDFMSLLKALQRQLTCVQVPWLPAASGSTAYLINEIVTGEESDVDQHGVRMSHYELYLRAMQELQADTAVIEQFVADLRAGQSVKEALENADIPAGAKAFVSYTFSVIERNRPHEIAAAFTYGREDLIPELFIELVRNLNARFPNQLDTFRYYLDRHIEVDGGHHGHLAEEMVRELCGDDAQKWEETISTAEESIRQRIYLWNSITSCLNGRALVNL